MNEEKKTLVETLKDPIVLGSIGMAVAAHNPTVSQVIAQGPETVSAVISLITMIISLFKKRK